MVSAGAFGEEVMAVAITEPHRALVIESRARVDVHAPPIAFAFDTPWESIRTSSLQSRELGPEGPASFIYPTVRTPLAAEITDYARQSFTPGRPIIEAASELMGRIHADFSYDPDATDVRTPAREAFEARRGVCQDFAHIMISGLRGLGLPAAYVSGYLNTGAGADYQGADATHAGGQLWCGKAAGWVGFDPTNLGHHPQRPHRPRHRPRLRRRRPHRRRPPRPRPRPAPGRRSAGGRGGMSLLVPPPLIRRPSDRGRLARPRTKVRPGRPRSGNYLRPQGSPLGPRASRPPAPALSCGRDGRGSGNYRHSSAAPRTAGVSPARAGAALRPGRPRSGN